MLKRFLIIACICVAVCGSTAQARVVVTHQRHHAIQPSSSIQARMKEKAESQKRYDAVEEELIEKYSPSSPVPNKADVKVIVDESGHKHNVAPKTVPEKAPDPFGPVGGVGAIGGIGSVGETQPPVVAP